MHMESHRTGRNESVVAGYNHPRPWAVLQKIVRYSPWLWHTENVKHRMATIRRSDIAAGTPSYSLRYVTHRACTPKCIAVGITERLRHSFLPAWSLPVSALSIFVFWKKLIRFLSDSVSLRATNTTPTFEGMVVSVSRSDQKVFPIAGSHTSAYRQSVTLPFAIVNKPIYLFPILC